MDIDETGGGRDRCDGGLGNAGDCGLELLEKGSIVPFSCPEFSPRSADEVENLLKFTTSCPPRTCLPFKYSRAAVASSTEAYAAKPYCFPAGLLQEVRRPLLAISALRVS